MPVQYMTSNLETPDTHACGVYELLINMHCDLVADGNGLLWDMHECGGHLVTTYAKNLTICVLGK